MFKFSRLFRGSYFRVLVVCRENRENLDLAKIFRYTVYELNSHFKLIFIIIPFYNYMHTFLLKMPCKTTSDLVYHVKQSKILSVGWPWYGANALVQMSI